MSARCASVLSRIRDYSGLEQEQLELDVRTDVVRRDELGHSPAVEPLYLFDEATLHRVLGRAPQSDACAETRRATGPTAGQVMRAARRQRSSLRAP